jgi:cytochrome c-type biogenesis protein CcmH
MLWVVFALLTGAAVLSVVWPLARTPRGLSRSAIDVAFYKSQIAQIDRDASDGLVGPADVEGAKAEAARRLLGAAKAPVEPSAANAGSNARFAAIAAFIFVPGLTLALYGAIGHPNLPDLPLAARMQETPARMDLLAAVAKIEEHLARNPQDGRGYEVLAPVYMRMGRYGDAASAYASALRLNGDTPERQALYGQALVAAANGQVTPEAKAAFENATAKDPAAPRPRFYLGLAAAQAGDNVNARDIWEKLLAQSPPDAPWAASLRENLAMLSGAPEPSQPEAASSGPGANPALAAKIADMSGADQATAIHGMVDKLAARLAQNGRDVEGWLRLVRAYAVLKESDKARSALTDAKRSLAGDAAATGRIDELARELGLEG